MHYLSPPSSLNNEGKIQEIYSAGPNIWDGGFSNPVKRKKLLFPDRHAHILTAHVRLV
jgi:hypothetical protein